MAERSHKAYEERRRQIMDAALDVFGTKGFVEATNKDIAQAAGIRSPGLIYHYFESKEDLLRAVIEHNMPLTQMLGNPGALAGMPLEEALTLIGRTYLRVMDDPKIGGCLRVVIGERIRSAGFADDYVVEAGPARVLRLLSEYLKRKMDEGLLEPSNPAISARCFIGPLAAYMLARNVLRLPDEPGVDSESMVAAAVSVFLDGSRRKESGDDEAR